MTDSGETRSVSASRFPTTHQHLEGTPFDGWGVSSDERARPGEIVVSPEGSGTAAAGQWVLRDSTGQWLVSDSHLGAGYALADEPSRQ